MKIARYLQCLGGPYAGCLVEDRGERLIALPPRVYIAVDDPRPMDSLAKKPESEIYRLERITFPDSAPPIDLYIHTGFSLRDAMIDLLRTQRIVSKSIGPASEKLPGGVM